MEKYKNRNRKKYKPRRTTTKRAITEKTPFGKRLYSFLSSFWKVIVGLGIILGIIVAIKTLFYRESTRQITIETPIFQKSIEELSVTVGTTTIAFKRSGLKEGKITPFNFNGFKPVQIYIEDEKLYADISVYAGIGLPPISIKKNIVFGVPNKWDLNYNQTALEIVTEQHKPVYQYIYKSPSELVIYGIFTYSGGLMLATEKGNLFNPLSGTIFRLEPIFKYPSWRYRGQYKDN